MPTPAQIEKWTQEGHWPPKTEGLKIVKETDFPKTKNETALLLSYCMPPKFRVVLKDISNL